MPIPSPNVIRGIVRRACGFAARRPVRGEQTQRYAIGEAIRRRLPDGVRITMDCVADPRPCEKLGDVIIWADDDAPRVLLVANFSAEPNGGNLDCSGLDSSVEFNEEGFHSDGVSRIIVGHTPGGGYQTAPCRFEPGCECVDIRVQANAP